MVVKCIKTKGWIKSGDTLQCIYVSQPAHGYESGYYIKRPKDKPSEALRVSAAEFAEHFQVVAK